MTLSLNPEFVALRDGYTFDPGYATIEAQLEGGLTRKRQEAALYPVHTINVNWVLSPEQYTRFMGFFRTDLQEGTHAFLMDLVTTVAMLLPHKCRTKGGLPKLTQKKGLNFSVAATLEVEQNPTYSGLIAYTEPDQIIFPVADPYLAGPIKDGDTLRIIDSSGTHTSGTFLNMDGVYQCDGNSGFNIITLASPWLVNSAWTILATLGAPGIYGDESNGNIRSTVVRIPT